MGRAADATQPRIVDAWIERADGSAATSFHHGEAMVLQGEAHEPDDRPPVLLFGIVRADGTPVYGSHSNEGGYEPARLGPQRYGFAVRFERIALLPGKYRLRVHTLDAAGLRLFDTVERDFVVTGESRDYGLVALPHQWLPGRGLPA